MELSGWAVAMGTVSKAHKAMSGQLKIFNHQVLSGPLI